MLQLIAEGSNAKNVAYLLNINVKTVDTHRQQIMKKLGLSGMAALAKYALRAGFIPLD